MAGNETRLLTLEEAQRIKGIGWEEVWFQADEDEGEPEGVELFECVFINGHIRGADGDVGEVDADTYNQPYHSRLWLGADKPTMEQRVEAKWA